MNYTDEIGAASADPQKLEALFRQAQHEGNQAVFASTISANYAAAPDNLLYAAWHYRLQDIPTEAVAGKSRAGVWRLAITFAILSGLALGALAAWLGMFLGYIPYLLVFWAPVAAVFAILFLVLAAGADRRSKVRSAILAIGLLVAASVYVLLIAPGQKNWAAYSYLNLMAIHLPLLAWIALGLTLLGMRSLLNDRFAFLIKSIETAITAGLFLIACVAFGLITMGMLDALNIQLPEKMMLFLVGGGFGLIPIIALATIYDPRLPPGEQDFSQGLSKFVAAMMRLLLPLTLIVLVIYVILIPFNFVQPFQQRDVLIVYNIMLFAIMGLLLGATPIRAGDLSPRLLAALRAGILVVAGLAILVGLYALSAVLYRSITDSLTMNRLVTTGWNVINICILGFLVYGIFKGGKDGWIERSQAVFARSMPAYVGWTLFVIIAIPLLYR
jgi:hypothetical protein